MVDRGCGAPRAPDCAEAVRVVAAVHHPTYRAPTIEPAVDRRFAVSNSTADAGTTATFNGGGGANDVLTRNANTFALESDLDFDSVV
jgi:hypothetical protein